MRVHPSQLSSGFFPFRGPSHFWVKSFNLNNKKIVFPICILFLISVIGSAINKDTVGNIKNKLLLLSASSPVSEPLAVVLSNAESRIFLLSAPTKQSGSLDKKSFSLTDLELTTSDRVFLEESQKFGTLSVVPLSDAAEYPLLNLRSVKELKELLAASTVKLSAPPIIYEITSRVFDPGQPEIYGITDTGQIVEVTSNGQIIESAVE